MSFLKNIGTSFIWILAILFSLTIILTIMSYFDVFGEKITTIFKILIPIISLFIGGIQIGKKSIKKGWLEGLKLSLIFIIILLIFNYLGLNKNFEAKNILFYIILIISTMFGSMIGINKNKETSN